MGIGSMIGGGIMLLLFSDRNHNLTVRLVSYGFVYILSLLALAAVPPSPSIPISDLFVSLSLLPSYYICSILTTTMMM